MTAWIVILMVLCVAHAIYLPIRQRRLGRERTARWEAFKDRGYRS